MTPKEDDIYPKYCFRLSHDDKAWPNRELEALKAKFNAGGDGSFPVITKNVLLISALKRGLRFFREDAQSHCVHQNIELPAEASAVWRALTEMLAPHLRAGTQAVPNESLQFTWTEPDWRDGESTACSIRLRASFHGGTRVEVVHSGWEVFPGAEATARKAAFDAKWRDLLARLAAP